MMPSLRSCFDDKVFTPVKKNSNRKGSKTGTSILVRSDELQQIAKMMTAMIQLIPPAA
jgi:hypothetical protein